MFVHERFCLVCVICAFFCVLLWLPVVVVRRPVLLFF